MSDFGYYMDGEKARGPFLQLEMRRLAAEGTIKSSTLVRRGVDGAWFEAGQFKDFNSATQMPQMNAACDATMTVHQRPQRGASQQRRPVSSIFAGIALVGFVAIVIFGVSTRLRNDRRMQRLRDWEDLPAIKATTKPVTLREDLMSEAVFHQSWEGQIAKVRIKTSEELLSWAKSGKIPHDRTLEELLSYRKDSAKRANIRTDEYIQKEIEKEKIAFDNLKSNRRVEIKELSLDDVNPFESRKWGVISGTVEVVRKDSDDQFYALYSGNRGLSLLYFDGWSPGDAKKVRVDGGAFVVEGTKELWLEGTRRELQRDRWKAPIIMHAFEKDQLEKAVIDYRSKHNTYSDGERF